MNIKLGKLYICPEKITLWRMHNEPSSVDAITPFVALEYVTLRMHVDEKLLKVLTSNGEIGYITGAKLIEVIT